MDNQLTKREQAALSVLTTLARELSSSMAEAHVLRHVSLAYQYADAMLAGSTKTQADFLQDFEDLRSKKHTKAEPVQTEPVQTEPVQAEQPKAVQAEQVYTLDDVRAKVTEVMKADKSKKGALQALLKSHGADRVSELDESKFAAVIDAIEKGAF